MQQATLEDTLAKLSRLADKPGVQATLVLSRQSGDIVQSSGLEKADSNAQTNGIGQGGPEGTNAARTGSFKPVEEVASMIFNYVTASARIAREMTTSEGDEVKLLRMRMKRSELVIVPDAHYIAVVIHDTPPA
ncbi:hypothetical protein BDZ85DRAFT_78486 [Elsinoe ampelina]|uniref:Roadblock/LAMTOR2 domain-containing protein n=1 Tax=Elsinoe ampelina TaxID=302913 RepID=A0A6A6FYW8_9PEZI|nr:hypothetical protein BDZ85DRAFT_78486 [Elsinoe ampelina]